MNYEEQSDSTFQAGRVYPADTGGQLANRPSMTTITQDAEEALGLAHRLHELLNSLENRCFPPELKEVSRGGTLASGSGEDARRIEPIGSVIRHTRQRLDSALSRFEQILQRL